MPGGGGTGGGPGRGGGSGDMVGGGGGGRSVEELIHPVKAVLAKLTGQDFTSPATVHAWVSAHAKAIKQAGKVLNDSQKEQAKVEKAHLKGGA